MAIKIVPDGTDIYLTESEAKHYRDAYRHFCHFHVPAPTFEEFVRSNPFKDRSYEEARAEVARLARLNTHKFA